MGKYSSDSDSEKRRSKSAFKNRNRRRSSSSSSTESSSRRRKRKSDKRKSRSRSRERYSRSRRSRSGSSSAYKTKSRRSSRSRDRSRYKRSRSRDRHRSKHRRSRSRSYIREYTSIPQRHSTSSSSSSSSEIKETKSENQSNKQVAGSPRNLHEEMTKIDVKVYNEINDDNFTPKQFSSSKSRKMLDNIVIDLKKQTIKVPEVEPVEPDSIFHHNLFLNEEARMEKWIKELYAYRQKALQQGLKAGDK